MSFAPTLVCDGLTSSDAVGASIRGLLRSSGRAYIASPYVSGNPQRLLGLPKSRWSTLSLVCNLDSGNCDPRVLKQILDQGATVLTYKQLHAKVYMSNAGIAIGSANLSPNGLGMGTIEAAVLVRGSSAKATIHKWFKWLQRVSIDTSPLLNDPEEFAKLLVRWQARQRAHQGPSGSIAKPSLLAAILRNLPSLNDVTFSWYTTDVALKKSIVKATAKQQQIPIPSKTSEWTWVECPFKPGLKERLNKMCRGKPQIAWEAKLDDDVSPSAPNAATDGRFKSSQGTKVQNPHP